MGRYGNPFDEPPTTNPLTSYLQSLDTELDEIEAASEEASKERAEGQKAASDRAGLVATWTDAFRDRYFPAADPRFGEDQKVREVVEWIVDTKGVRDRELAEQVMRNAIGQAKSSLPLQRSSTLDKLWVCVRQGRLR